MASNVRAVRRRAEGHCTLMMSYFMQLPGQCHMSAAGGAGTEKQRGTRVRPGAPADGRPTTPSLRDCLWTPATNAWPVTSVWAHGGASTAAVNHTNLAENYGTLCRRRSSAQPAQMQLLAPRLLEAASSTRRPRGKYRGKPSQGLGRARLTHHYFSAGGRHTKRSARGGPRPRRSSWRMQPFMTRPRRGPTRTGREVENISDKGVI